MPFIANPDKPDHFTLRFLFKGKPLSFHAHKYYFKNNIESWYIQAKNGMLTFDWHVVDRKLKQTFVYGSTVVPDDFFQSLEQEFVEFRRR